ncbi:hypothetical protein J6590_060441 [Homalodisca vitripennis]|nr:hypothetical protein J6590_060441 [Homalodisca vitripennis]
MPWAHCSNIVLGIWPPRTEGRTLSNYSIVSMFALSCLSGKKKLQYQPCNKFKDRLLRLIGIRMWYRCGAVHMVEAAIMMQLDTLEIRRNAQNLFFLFKLVNGSINCLNNCSRVQHTTSYEAKNHISQCYIRNFFNSPLLGGL